MAIKKSQLYTKLWQACDELRGGMDASQYKDYVLVVLFIKYISDRAKNGDADLYIDLPDGCAFDDLIALKGKPDIGERMNVILARIGEANEQLAGTITNADFADEQKLGKGKDLVETVSNLIGVFQDKDLDLSNNRAADDDLIGDAYEYLMKNFATQSGKSKGQFYTPGEVSRVMARVVNIAADKRPMISIYDMTCGSGSLLIRAAAEANRPFDQIAIEGQEKDLATIGMAKMSMVIHGIDDAELKHGNTLSDPLHKADDTHLKTFDYGFANPPFSVKGWMKGAQEKDPFKRWGHEDGVAPVPPPKCGDYAFLLHMIKSLKSDGKGAIILPHGVLFRGNAEGEIRKFIVQRHLIKGIIGLPANLFFGTGIPACIIVLDKSLNRNPVNPVNPVEKEDGIFMIDAKDGFAKEGAKNRLRECDIRRIVDTWEAQADVPHYARLVPYSEIEKNDYNLNIPRYIAPVDKEIHQDIVAHLKGGIPETDAAKYPAALFKALRKGYVEVRSAEGGGRSEEVAALLENDPVTTKAGKSYLTAIEMWLGYFVDQGRDYLKQGDNPKVLIREWGDMLMREMTELKSPLVDRYAPYEHLMNYWAETMQDDCYLISRDGWKVELQPPAKKNASWEDYACDLLPVQVVVNESYAPERDKITALKIELEENAAAIAEIDEKLDEENSEEDIDEEALADERKELDKKGKAIKREIKAANEDLVQKLVKDYGSMDERAIRHYVVETKWADALWAKFQDELARVKAQIVTEVKALAARYAETLPDAEAKVCALEKKVAKHLAAMGIEV